jgi:hypothetical protein
MSEHGQGYEDSGRPMMVVAEVWPVAADELGLWLLSGDGPRPSLPVMDDAEPFDYAEMELMQAGMWATTKVLHSTSWRVDRGDLVVTYLAVVGCDGLVRSRWPDALPISVKVADAVGQPPTHAAAEPPTVRYIDVLHHALRHLRFLTDPSSIGFDAPIARELDETWQRHLTTFEPAIARMYGREHRPLSPPAGAGPNG